MPDKKDRIYLDGAWRYLLDNREIIDEDDMASNSATRVPTQQSVKAYADALIAANDAMVFKGVIDCSGNPNYPAADCGHTYKVSVAGKIGGASGVVVEVGDIAICKTDSSASGDHATVGANWIVLQTNIEDLDSVIDALISTHASIAATHFAAWDDLTIDGDGAVDITGKTGKCFRIHPIGAETEDILDTITGGTDGQIITITGNADTYPITITSDDNISLPGENNILTHYDRTCTLIFNGSVWVLESFGDPIGYIGRSGFNFSYAAVGISWSTGVLTTDHSYTGEWSNVVAGETFTGNAFQVGYMNADGEVYLAKANNSTTMPAFCMNRNADNQADGLPIGGITEGYVRDDTWNWTPGLLYVSKDTAGAMTQTKPVYPNIAQVVGVALTADIIYFNPSLKAEDYAGILTALKAETDISGASWVLDEDNMASNSATKVPTQQSVKAYVDAAGGGGGDETISWLGI